MKRILGFVLALSLVFGLKFYNRSSSSAEVHDSMVAVVRRLPVYSAEREYVDKLFEEAHAKAFNASYKIGGRRSAGTFDHQKYLSLLFGEMAERATAEKHRELAVQLVVVLSEISDGMKPAEG